MGASSFNRPLALRSHVTNIPLYTMSWNPADAKNWQSTSKLSHMSTLRAKQFKGGNLWQFDFFNKVFWFVLAAMSEGTTLPSNMAAKTSTWLYLVKHLVFTLKFAVNTATSKCKIYAQKDIFHNFKNFIFVMLPDANLIIFRKWCRFLKSNYYYFV